MVTEAIRSEPLAPSPEFCARAPLPACREPTKAGSDLPNCHDLARMSDAQLAQHDIAAVNLACTAGLPGAEVIDVARCLGTLDAWAAHVRLKTEVGACRFRQDPARWDGASVGKSRTPSFSTEVIDVPSNALRSLSLRPRSVQHGCC
jgi:hypothetical protein